jgi:hypothetical protein
MAKKTNSKAVAAKERKGNSENEKKNLKEQELESKNSKDWERGSKDNSKREQQELKKKEEERKREEKRLIQQQEEAELAKLGKPKLSRQIKTEYSASGLDDALDLLKLTSAQKIELDRHPERRMKAAYQAFEATELARLKQENPGLRLGQVKEQVQKLWKKSPLNPMNQAHVAFNASKDELRDAQSQLRDQKLSEFESK